MGILLHETLIAAVERPTLIYASLALLGLPLVIRSDERKNEERGHSSERQSAGRDRSGR